MQQKYLRIKNSRHKKKTNLKLIYTTWKWGLYIHWGWVTVTQCYIVDTKSLWLLKYNQNMQKYIKNVNVTLYRRLMTFDVHSACHIVLSFSWNQTFTATCFPILFNLHIFSKVKFQHLNNIFVILLFQKW
jgi:hypothetical protein